MGLPSSQHPGSTQQQHPAHLQVSQRSLQHFACGQQRRFPAGTRGEPRLAQLPGAAHAVAAALALGGRRGPTAESAQVGRQLQRRGAGQRRLGVRPAQLLAHAPGGVLTVPLIPGLLLAHLPALPQRLLQLAVPLPALLLLCQAQLELNLPPRLLSLPLAPLLVAALHPLSLVGLSRALPLGLHASQETQELVLAARCLQRRLLRRTRVRLLCCRANAGRRSAAARRLRSAVAAAGLNLQCALLPAARLAQRRRRRSGRRTRVRTAALGVKLQAVHPPGGAVGPSRVPCRRIPALRRCCTAAVSAGFPGWQAHCSRAPLCRRVLLGV